MKLFKNLLAKTVVILTMFSLVFFSMSLVNADGIDVTPPEIKGVTFSPKIVKPGDVINVIVETTDSESGFPTDPNIDCGEVNFQSKVYDNIILTKHSGEELYFNPSTGKLHARITIPQDARNGDYYISIFVRDRFNNSDIKPYPNEIITIVSASDDYTPPTIKSLNYSPTTVRPGDLVKMISL